MTRADLVDRLASKSPHPKYLIKTIVDELFDEIQDALTHDEKVSIRGFGTFETKIFKSHPAIHPGTKESIVIPSFKNVVFRPGDELIRNVRDV